MVKEIAIGARGRGFDYQAVNSTQGRQEFATVAMLLRSCVVPGALPRNGPRHLLPAAE